MRRIFLLLFASLLMAFNVDAAESASPASIMVSHLGDATRKCQELSLKQYSQEQSDNSMSGKHLSAMEAIADASSNRALDDDRYDACLATARDAGKAAYEKYQAVSGQPQAIQEDARTVYITWLAALPDLTKIATPATPEISELLAYRKALAGLRVDDVAR